MASEDWLSPMRVVGAGVAWFFAVIFLGAYQVLSSLFSFLARCLPTYIYNFLHFITIPVVYPIWYISKGLLGLLAFVLSPVWVLLKAFAGAGSWVVGVLQRLQYLYIYFAIAAIIGIAAACMVHGTSSVIFMVLGITQPSSKSGRLSRPQQQQLPAPVGRADEDDDGEDGEEGDDPESSSTAQSFWDPPTDVDPHRRPYTQRMNEDRWRQAKSTLLSPVKPSRRSRGLLAQTIHEESRQRLDGTGRLFRYIWHGVIN
ncbi:hypothetical protein BJ170DRAFT_593506 [Xylariales sp. AK1849]|nr:hypothetical protein BJ170DRAFT_593506 [Xylariales sp. AK1849]